MKYINVCIRDEKHNKIDVRSWYGMSIMNELENAMCDNGIPLTDEYYDMDDNERLEKYSDCIEDFDDYIIFGDYGYKLVAKPHGLARGSSQYSPWMEV